MSGGVLTYAGGSLTLSGVSGSLIASAALGGGVQLELQTTTAQALSNDARNDFNGDGRSDILWRNDAGQVSNWLGASDGGFVNNDALALVSVPTNWYIAGTGDFNGDGRDDILWRNDAGQISNWLGTAGGGFVNNDTNALTAAPINWSVAAIGDYNGDGRDDILWHDANGGTSDWLGTANGGFINNDANALTIVATSWYIQPDPPLL